MKQAQSGALWIPIKQSLHGAMCIISAMPYEAWTLRYRYCSIRISVGTGTAVPVPQDGEMANRPCRFGPYRSPGTMPACIVQGYRYTGGSKFKNE